MRIRVGARVGVIGLGLGWARCRVEPAAPAHLNTDTDTNADADADALSRKGDPYRADLHTSPPVKLGVAYLLAARDVAQRVQPPRAPPKGDRARGRAW